MLLLLNMVEFQDAPDKNIEHDKKMELRST